MKQLINYSKLLLGVAVLALTAACTTTESHSSMLAAAGFQQRAADTPQKQELLKTLPPDKLTLIQWKGKSYYVQPEHGTNTAWVGRSQEYQAYQQLRLAKQMSNDNLMAAQMNQDAMYRWGGVWGPGFYGGGFYGARWR